MLGGLRVCSFLRHTPWAFIVTRALAVEKEMMDLPLTAPDEN
jgi:hypothetical protein